MTLFVLSLDLSARGIPLTLDALLISDLSVFAVDGEKRQIPAR